MRTIFSSEDNQLRGTFVKSLLFLLVTTSIAAFSLFFITKYLLFKNAPCAPTITIQLGMRSGDICRVAEHPLPFLLIISIILAFVGATWTTLIAPRWANRHNLQILALPWVALVITSPIWGFIWSIYEWPPQEFSSTAKMILFYKHDIVFGLSFGWLSAIQSSPINILSYTTVCVLLFINMELFLRRDADSSK